MYSPKTVRVQTLSNVIISIRIHKEEKLTTAGGALIVLRHDFVALYFLLTYSPWNNTFFSPGRNMRREGDTRPSANSKTDHI